MPPWPRRVQQGPWSFCAADVKEDLRTKAETAPDFLGRCCTREKNSCRCPLQVWPEVGAGLWVGVGFLFWATSLFSILRLPAAVTVNSRSSGCLGQAEAHHCLCRVRASVRRQETLSLSQHLDLLEKLRCLLQLFQPSFRDSVLLSGTSGVLVSGGEMTWELRWFGDLSEGRFSK